MIFIGGTGRCGTSILSYSLMQDDRCALFFEPQFLTFPGGLLEYAIDRRITKEEFLVNMRGKFLRQILRHLNRMRVLPEAKSVYNVDFINSIDLAAVAGGQRDKYAKMFTEMFLNEIHKYIGTSEILYKQPHLITKAGILQWMFPDSKFIHIIRDPRDVCSSVIKLSWGPNSVKEFPAYYLDIMGAALEQRADVPDDRYLVLSFDSLITHHWDIMYALYRFFDCNVPTSDLLSKLGKPIDQNRAHSGRYKTDLSRKQSAFIYDECWEIYQKWLKISI